MLKSIKRDRRSTAEKLFDEKLEDQLRDADSLDEISEIMTLMGKRAELGNKRRISLDTMATIACNLIGIVLILEYERTHVIASKALGFVIRGRV